MGYSFDFLTEEFSAAYIKQVVQTLEERVSDGWPCWAISNHDVERVISRWGKSQNAEQNSDLAKMLFAMISSLRGSVCSYQGEELGLTEADIAFEDIQDPYGITFWPQFKGRDGCRTPQPWQHDEVNAGFSQAKPWLPVAIEHQEKSVDLQENSTDSVLNSYRNFTQWRKQHSALLYGDITFVDTPEPILSFIRQDNDEKLLVCFNFSNQAQRFSLDLFTDEHLVISDHNLTTANVIDGQIVDGHITLPAFGCFYASL
jgi:alpha-glucosidase